VALHVAGWSDDADATDRREGIDLARRALTVAGNDPEILSLAARVLGYFGEDLAAAIASPCAGRRRASWSNKRRRWLFDTPPETAVFDCRELFLFLVGVYVWLRGTCGTHHRAVICLCRTVDQALTVSNDLPCGRDNMLECRAISPTLYAEETRS
jgi:hypothetical protein